MLNPVNTVAYSAKLNMDRFAELKAFCMVANGGGFSAAGRQLGLATSSVTRLVDSLERRLGAVLLNRSTRSVTLTDAGRAYYERALRLLEELDFADDAAGAHAGEPQGLLRVAAPVTFCAMHIAPMLPALARRYPRLELDLRLSDTVSNMVDESIDVAIRIGSAGMAPNLIARRLAAHERVICASPGYLASHGAPLTPDDLALHNCMQFAYGDGRHVWRLKRGEEVHEVPVHGALTVNNADVLRQAALGGMGLALLAQWLVRPELESGALRRVLAEYDANPGAMDVGLFAIYQANRRGSAKIKAFIDLLESALGSELVAQPDADAVRGIG